MSETIEFWRADFGDGYVERNRLDWAKRVPFWRHIIDRTNAQSFLEVGCNIGLNLQAIRSLNSEFMMTGCDVNSKALGEATAAGFDVLQQEGHLIADLLGPECCDLAFTCGVLIHVSPDQLQATMEAIKTASSAYVLAVEYEAQEETEVEYRGHAGRLWKRPYGKLYEEMGLSLVETGEVGAADGFDPKGCRWWLLEK